MQVRKRGYLDTIPLGRLSNMVMIMDCHPSPVQFSLNSSNVFGGVLAWLGTAFDP